ncbi:MAG: hypothetical protein HFF02_03465 [Erysipelotrichaceae bacterium]|nr:hypothetical protein [Erysipelotrichaceae bacterium]
MGVLTRLWYLKQKAMLRNLFRKPASAILTIFMILIYGVITISLLINPAQVYVMKDLHMAVLCSIGFSALLTFSLLLSKRKALFYETDSFILFSGPFTRKQVMRYLFSQTIIQSLMFSFITVFIFITLAAGFTFTFPFLMTCLFGYFMLYMLFLSLTDYVYVLSITNQKYKMFSKLIVASLVVITLCICIVHLANQDFQFQNGMWTLVESPLFYYVPVFGWMKMLLFGVVDGNTMQAFISGILMLTAVLIVYFLMTSFQGDFYEQALLDAQEITAMMKSVKSGKNNGTRINTRMHKANVKFQTGAGAIYSKNILIMKKTRDFISITDIISIGIYFSVSYFMDLGYPMYCYMLIFWLFQVMNTSDLVTELKNYQIYLIPAKPFAKLWYAILPTLYKVLILVSVSMLVGGVLFQVEAMDIFQYWLMLIGYVSIFISATVLSIRILKSRTNAVMEQMMRMLLIILCSLPGILLTVYMLINQVYDETLLFVAGNLSLILNLVLSACILCACKNMLNGRELNDD